MSTTDPSRGILELDTAHLDAALFDLDGVIATTAKLHEKAWRASLSELIGGPELTSEEYRRHIDGKAREAGASAILSARGADDHLAGRLGKDKNARFLELLKTEKPEPLPGAVDLLKALRQQGIAAGLFTASRNGRRVLRALPDAIRFAAIVDGVVAEDEGLKSKPAPDLPLACASRLGADPWRCVLFEDAVAGVRSGDAGGFAFVVGIGEGDHAAALTRAGADAVIPSLASVRLDR